MKNFRDSAGTEWTVFEVRRGVSGKGDRSYLPSGFNDGWLCFESSSAKRRLTRYPEQWREFGEVELTQLLAEASPAPRISLRLGDDFGDTSRDADARAE